MKEDNIRESIELLDKTCESLTNSGLEEIQTGKIIDRISDIQTYLGYLLGDNE